MIKIEQISKSFKDTQVLQGISFEINKGDFGGFVVHCG